MARRTKFLCLAVGLMASVLTLTIAKAQSLSETSYYWVTPERTLIAGFIVTGGEPRNGEVVAQNSDWRSDARAEVLSRDYPTLRPPNDKEAAMFLTLMPGAFTIHGSNEDGGEKVILLEVYDVDANDL